MTCEVLKTKFGNAKIGSLGYYQITSKKEGNHNKMLHRLIIEDFYNTTLPDDWVVHHDDGNKTNNNIWNLIPMPKSEHSVLHHKGMKHSELSKQKMSESQKGRIVSKQTREKISLANKGRKMSEETKLKMSLNHSDVNGENNPMYGKKHSLSKRMMMSQGRNSSGYFRVNKHKSKKVKQGFMWRYQYYDENGKRVSIESINLKELQKKVEAKGLLWKKLDGGKEWQEPTDLKIRY